MASAYTCNMKIVLKGQNNLNWLLFVKKSIINAKISIKF